MSTNRIDKKEAARLEVLNSYPEELRSISDQLLRHIPAEMSPNNELMSIVSKLRRAADEITVITNRQARQLHRNGLRVVKGGVD